jgi:hypothetical protein
MRNEQKIYKLFLFQNIINKLSFADIQTSLDAKTLQSCQ